MSRKQRFSIAVYAGERRYDAALIRGQVYALCGPVSRCAAVLVMANLENRISASAARLAASKLKARGYRHVAIEHCAGDVECVTLRVSRRRRPRKKLSNPDLFSAISRWQDAVPVPS